MKSPKEPDHIKITEEQVKNLQDRLRQNKLSDEERELLAKVLQGFVWLNKMLEAKKLSMRKLSRLFGFKTEKIQNQDPASKDKSPEDDKNIKDKSSGRNGQKGHDKFSGAKRVFHEHDELSKGDRCPACGKGNLYNVDPGIFIHIAGAPPLTATVHEAEKLRCAACGATFTANVPKEARVQKYDETADALIALMKYGIGTPFHRLGKLQKSLGVPLPASTQWERVEALSNSVYPIYQELIKQAARSEVSYVDDTGARILDEKKRLKVEGANRTGLYTTGVVSKSGDKTIKIFFTGNRHAGENLGELLKSRPEELAPMIHMSDGLASNRPKNIVTTMCGCLTHARRGFFDALPDRKKECEYVISIIRKIYQNDRIATERGMNASDRLHYHQRKSTRWMTKLRRWGLKCFYLKKVEPNDSLGEALQYLFNHWEKLTQFLRVPGAPLDNNIVERLLKTAILHRKNALFFKTWMGALVGDIMMSLIQTCIAAGKNPFDYLVAVHRNWNAVKARPGNFMPWNFEENLSFS